MKNINMQMLHAIMMTNALVHFVKNNKGLYQPGSEEFNLFNPGDVLHYVNQNGFISVCMSFVSIERLSDCSVDVEHTDLRVTSNPNHLFFRADAYAFILDRSRNWTTKWDVTTYYTPRELLNSRLSAVPLISSVDCVGYRIDLL